MKELRRGLLFVLLLGLCLCAPVYCADSFYAVVNASGEGASLRIGPGTEYKTALDEKIPNGEVLYCKAVAAAEDGNEWGYTSYHDTIGWISLAQVEISNTDPDAEADQSETAAEQQPAQSGDTAADQQPVQQGEIAAQQQSGQTQEAITLLNQDQTNQDVQAVSDQVLPEATAAGVSAIQITTADPNASEASAAAADPNVSEASAAATDPNASTAQAADTQVQNTPVNQAYVDFISSDVTEYPNVKVYLDMTDDYGDPITISSLSGSVTETIAGGTAIERTVRRLERLEGNQGVSFDIVADKSGSMEYDLGTMQNIMSDFVGSLDYASGDQVELISFDSYVMYMCTYTQNVELLRNGINNMTPYGETALYDALYAGVTNAGNQSGAKCVIGFTDGYDNNSTYTEAEVINLAQMKGVPVYLIGTTDSDTGTLDYISSSTGGYYWTIDSISGIGEILSEIYAVEKDMYCLEYVSDAAIDPYTSRMISCTLSGDGYSGTLSDYTFQPVQVLQKVQHESRYEVVKEDISWEEANSACIAKGGHLATITSQEEMNQLIAMCEGQDINYCWIGGYTSLRNDDAFGHWVTGEPFTFTAWYPGEPSRNDEDGTAEFYLMLWKVEDEWSWNDQRNDVIETGLSYFPGHVGYICEYES